MSRKPWVLIATLLASSTVATSSLADDTSPAPPQTWTTPPTTEAVSTEPTSTTTITAADDTQATAAPPLPIEPTPRESVIIERHQKPHKALLITGASMFITAYALTASFAGAAGKASDRDLFVPLAGPFMNLANPNCSRGCQSDDMDMALRIASGAVQNIGAVLMITSAFVPEKVPAARISAGPVKMHIAPTGGAGGGGLGAIGTF
jgi:hypothetical protein